MCEWYKNFGDKCHHTCLRIRGYHQESLLEKGLVRCVRGVGVYWTRVFVYMELRASDYKGVLLAC
jgi:hypothetical protein